MKTTYPRAAAPGAAEGGEGLLGPALLALAIAAGGVFFADGIAALLRAWQLPEYSHGPLIPLLSGFLFLRQLKEWPPTPAGRRWPGVAMIALALAIGLLGKLSHIDEIITYSMILWIYGMILTSFGWERGRHFWPPVVHLVFMLPLPGLIYYKVTTTLQFMSSELGVFLLRGVGVPVFLEGNIIDLGVYQLHVAEACSGLRYMFPIMSFTYIFAVLYRGPTWHKAVLLLSAVPLAVVMNSARIAAVGLLVNTWGIEQAEGFAHLLEGWVIFLSCIAILFGLAWAMLRLQPAPRMSLAEALDLEIDGILPQFLRLRRAQVSVGMIAATLLVCGAAIAWQAAPTRPPAEIDRAHFSEFPREIGGWRGDSPEPLTPSVEQALGANDYLSMTFTKPEAPAPVSFFSAWYLDQSQGGIHSPEVCLPGGGWEMERITTVDIADEVGSQQAFPVNRAVIRKNNRMLLVYYWFDQSGRRIASDHLAKVMLLWTGLSQGRTDGALVRVITPMGAEEDIEQAEVRLLDFLRPALKPLPRFVTGGSGS